MSENSLLGAEGNQPPEGTKPPEGSKPPEGTPPADKGWRSQLPKELQDEPSLTKFTSVEALAGAYKNAQKLIGGDKIPVPTKHTTEEEWGNIFRKLGLPEKMDEYGVKFKEGAPVDEKFTKDFQEQAYKLGLLPKQAQAMADWFTGINEGAVQFTQQQAKENFEKEVATLKQEWGNSFDLNISRANKAIKELGGDEILQHFTNKGLGADSKVMKFLATVGEKLYSEHKFVEGEGTSGTMSPKELDQAIRELQQNPAYFDNKHPSHKAVVEEAKELFAKRYNSSLQKK